MRVSSEEQVERESIGTQEEFLADYCKLYGFDAAGAYKDEAISGTVPVHMKDQAASDCCGTRRAGSLMPFFSTSWTGSGGRC